MKFYKVDQTWQLYLVYNIRANIVFNGIDHKLVDEFNEEFGKEYHYTLLADGETGIGTMRINYISDKVGKIERVAINSNYQKQGLGSQLLTYTEDVLKAQAIEEIIINAYEPALDFYLKNGYEIDRNVIIDEAAPQIRVRKKLAIAVD